MGNQLTENLDFSLDDVLILGSQRRMQVLQFSELLFAYLLQHLALHMLLSLGELYDLLVHFPDLLHVVLDQLVDASF